MANDLLIMSCKHCRGWIPLAKYFPSFGLTSRNHFMPVPEFIDRHSSCSYEYIIDTGGHDLNGDPQFELHTEEAFEEGHLLFGKASEKSSVEDKP